MKKLFTLVALGIVCATGAFAQKDVDLELTTSIDKTSIELGDSALVSLTIKNNGPEAIASTDTVVLGIAGETSASLLPLAPLAAGETKTFPNAIRIKHPAGMADTMTADLELEICWILLAQSDVTVGGRPLTVTYEDSDTTNDMSCHTVTLKKPTSAISLSGLSKVQLSVYPNPANNNINFTYSFDKASNTAVAHILDVTGRVVMTQDFGRQAAGEQSFNVNVAALPSGMYTLEFVADANRGISKFTVSK